MSTILNALKQVEEQIRNEAERRAADGTAPAADPAKPRIDLPAPPKAGASPDTDEMMKFYSGLIDALTRIQARMQGEMEQGLAEARGARDELAAAVAALQAQLPRQTEAMRQELLQRDADRDAANARLAALHAQTEALKKLFADATETSAQLSHAVAALQNDLIRQTQAVQREFQRRDADREAAVADAARALLAQSAETGAKLALSVAALRDDLTRNMAAVQEEFARRNAAQGAVQSDLAQAQALLAAVQAELGGLRVQCGAAQASAAENGAGQAELARSIEELKAGMARMTEAFNMAMERREAENTAETRVSQGPPQTDRTAAETESLSRLLEETRAANAELARTVTALQGDFARQSEAVRLESQQRDAEREAANTALAEAQSQIAALKRTLAERPAAEPPHAARSTACADTAKQATRIGKTDALQLHAAARKAYAKGNHAEALELLDVIDTAFPGNASVLCNRAQCLAGLGRRAEARKLCERLVNEMNHEPARELLVQLGG